MSKLYTKDFTVRGKAYFPVDMLRYDECFPVDSADASNIEKALDGTSDEVFAVKLRHQTENRYWMPNEARWKSFFWTVDYR